MHSPFDSIDGLSYMDEVVCSIDISLMMFLLLDVAHNEAVFDKTMTMQSKFFPVDSEKVYEIILTQNGVEKDGI